MATEPQPEMPMGDASMTSQEQPSLDGSMGNNMPDMDNNMSDMDMSGLNDNEMMNNEMPMDNSNPDKKRSEIQKNIGKACADFREYQGQDKEDLGKWISGMLDSLDGESSDGDVDMEGDTIDSPMENEPQEIPMESVIFSKKQVNKLNETFNDNLADSEDNVKIQKQRNCKTKNTPFNNPKFQK